MGEGIVLVVEDDEIIGAGLGTALQAEGYRVTWCTSGATGVAAAESAAHDLVLVVLTARADESSVVSALDAGADDFLTKPFRVVELLARIRAHRRRPVGARAELGELIEVGGLRIDVGARRVWSSGVELDLRNKEFDLLCVLARSAGQAMTRERIMCTVWDVRYQGSTKTLDMHVSALRRKLGDDPPATITTLRGVGYRLEVV
jgi:DNA-binding response OmpR family regulator